MYVSCLIDLHSIIRNIQSYKEIKGRSAFNGVSVKLSMVSDDGHPLLESPEPRDPRI